MHYHVDMNWVLLACLLIGLAIAAVGAVILGRAAYALYKAGKESREQTGPTIEAIIAGQEQAAILADRIAARQAGLADTMAATSNALASVAFLARTLADARDRLTTLRLD